LHALSGARDADDEPARLVARIQAGDRSAEAELVDRFSHGLLLMLRRLAQNPALADDLHQETLSLVLEKIRRTEVREPEKLAGFIRSTARNLFIADRRKEARYRPLDDGSEEEEGPRLVTRLADRGPAPLDRVLAGEEARQVQRLLDELRYDRDRQVLLRFYLSDHSKEEICADLGIEPEHFNQIIFRARERLRELWERAEKRQRFFAGAQRIVGRIGGDPARSR
jgi:RNA polymerase sigma-70 factor (ECF subfamily)